MDIYQKTIDLIKEYYLSEDGNQANLIHKVCAYFDALKETKLSAAQMSFLVDFANIVGIPQYMELLKDKYEKALPETEIKTLSNIGSDIHKASLTVDNGNVLHKYQKNVLDSFSSHRQNRYVLSAPTSFGKTYVVYEIIRKMNYENAVLIFPTISLLSENFERLIENENFRQYTLHTLSEDDELGEKNIWIFTPERFLSFIDKQNRQNFDFIFIDEVYKIDNEFIIDKETTGESERDVAYRIALEFAYRKTKDMLLAGPYMNMDLERKNSFLNFIQDKKFEILNYNDIEIVNKSNITIKSKKEYTIDGIKIPTNSNSIYGKTYAITKALTTPYENTIIYNNTKYGTERYAKEFIDLMQDEQIKFTCDDEIYNIFIEHLEKQFGKDWIIIRALKHGIGVHHGLVPKYIQKEIINLFNSGKLLILISTTTITEGVNTTAKNIIITSSKKGSKILRNFDAKNIAGRAGRFLKHYSGRVVIINNDFEEIIKNDDMPLQHKNFDENKDKTDVDFQITSEKYLTRTDIERKRTIEEEIAKRQIPNDIINQYKVVSPMDKINVYDKLINLSDYQQRNISHLISSLAYKKQITWGGFQVIIDILLPIVSEIKIKRLIETKCQDSDNSILTAKLYYYILGGFHGLLKYTLKTTEINKAMRDTSDLVYNTFRYQLVKYLGVFDIMYKYVKSMQTGRSIDEITGITILLQKLEHNAFNENARIVSDYGVPFSIIQYYDGNLNKQFDNYEQYIYRKVAKIVK